MNRNDFEHKVLELWTTTRVPLTRANIVVYTKAPRVKAAAWLDELVGEHVLDVDAGEDGELSWSVRGSKRPLRGVQAVGDAMKRDDGGSGILVRAAGGGLLESAKQAFAVGGAGAEDDKKSLVASGVLSFFFGPVGWLYAAPLKEAIPAAAAYLLVVWLLPHILLVWILGLANPVAALAGLLYAWSYNRNGKRMPLLLKDGESLPRLKR